MSDRKAAPALFFLNLEKLTAFLDKEGVKQTFINFKQTKSFNTSKGFINSQLFIYKTCMKDFTRSLSLGIKYFGVLDSN